MKAAGSSVARKASRRAMISAQSASDTVSGRAAGSKDVAISADAAAAGQARPCPVHHARKADVNWPWR